VILLDVNVVLAAQRADHPQHGIVRPWFEGLVEAGGWFGVPATVWASVVRLTTNRRIFVVPAAPEEAFAFARAVQAQSGYRAIEPGPRHLDIFEAVCTSADARADLVPDAFLAAVAMENAATVASFDRDFARFEGLSWVIPEAP
jgi:toxin-antitoxin system PIN domain toxin